MAEQQMTPEQAQAMQEKLKNMSPEELQEYQKQNCIFCQMVTGKIDVKKIFEDDKSLAVLDINPANAGHLLLMPKEHYAVMPLVPEDLISYLGLVAKELSNVMLKHLESKGTTVFIANGAAAGQKAQHVMIHIIPRYENDRIGIAIPKFKMEDSQLEEVKARLKLKVKEHLGYDIEVDEKVVESHEKEQDSEATDASDQEENEESVNLDDVSGLFQ
jgi:histidine triad (HIT) family protein